LKILEEYGVKKIRYYYAKIEHNNSDFYVSVEALFSSNHLFKMTIIAFLIGFFITIPCIWLELKLDVFNLNKLVYTNILLYMFSLLVLLFIEFFLLFHLGFYAIAYYVYHLNHIDEIEALHLKEDEFLSLFSRTIMELSEHNDSRHNINHKALNNYDLIFFSLLYKVKVLVSNFVLKVLMKNLLARSSLRVYSPYIASLGTGLWDAFVFYQTVKHSHYKIMVRYTILYILEYHQEIFFKENNIKAILARYYYYGEYNNNFEYLLSEISKHKSIDYSPKSYLDTSLNKACNQDLLLLLFCFREKIHAKKERNLLASIDKNNKASEIRKYFKYGKTKNIKAYVLNLKNT